MIKNLEIENRFLFQRFKETCELLEQQNKRMKDIESKVI